MKTEEKFSFEIPAASQPSLSTSFFDPVPDPAKRNEAEEEKKERKENKEKKEGKEDKENKENKSKKGNKESSIKDFLKDEHSNLAKAYRCGIDPATLKISPLIKVLLDYPKADQKPAVIFSMVHNYNSKMTTVMLYMPAPAAVSEANANTFLSGQIVKHMMKRKAKYYNIRVGNVHTLKLAPDEGAELMILRENEEKDGEMRLMGLTGQTGNTEPME